MSIKKLFKFCLLKCQNSSFNSIKYLTTKAKRYEKESNDKELFKIYVQISDELDQIKKRN